MAITTQTVADTDWEVVTKSTITGTNGTALKVVDVSALEGAATDPRVTIVAIWWTVSSVTEIEWNADSNVTAFTLNGNGNYNAGGQALPSISNNAGTAMSFIDVSGAQSQYNVIGFNSSGVPVATTTIDGGTF